MEKPASTGRAFMPGRDLVLRLVLAILPLVGALVLASLARHSELPGVPVLVLAILAGSVVLVLMRSSRS
jgi:hypothetical protein